MKLTPCIIKKKDTCKKKGEKVQKEWLKETIKRVCGLRGLSENTKIPLSTIQNQREPILLTGNGCAALMARIEPHLVALICAIAQICRCLRASKCIGSANDLINLQLKEIIH